MQDYSAFEEKLNEVHDWPCTYTFKCIVPAAEVDTFREKFQQFSFSERASSSGKYISFTLEFHADSSGHVVNVYQTAATIPGAMVL
jgi:hypothetical protein